MHPRIVEIVGALDSRRAELTRAVNEVPTIARNRRPSEGCWSVAEVLEHLALVEEHIAQLIRRLVADQRANGLSAERDSSSVAQMFDSTFVLDRSRKRVAREAMQPRGDVDAAAAWTHLERARQATQETVRDLDGMALGEVNAPHPALGPLNGYQWFLFLAAHEGRHAAQIREIMAATVVTE
jgi:DinB family protein